MGPNLLMMRIEHDKSCVFLGPEHAGLFPEVPTRSEAPEEADSDDEAALGDTSTIDIALLPASASLPAVSGVSPPADAPVSSSQRAIGANATCVTYAVKPGVVRVVCVLEQDAQQNASLYRVGLGLPL